MNAPGTWRMGVVVAMLWMVVLGSSETTLCSKPSYTLLANSMKLEWAEGMLATGDGSSRSSPHPLPSLREEVDFLRETTQVRL